MAGGAQAGTGLILTGSRYAFGAADMTPVEVPRQPTASAVNRHRLHVVFGIPLHAGPAGTPPLSGHTL